MILMYHNIGPEAGFNTIAQKDFTDQMAYVADHFRVVSLVEYIAELQNGNCDPATVVLSFDDAYTGFDRYVMPVLMRREFPAVLYIPSGYIGHGNAWDRHVPGGRPLELMGYDVLRDLAGMPEITIGSHGVSHQRLRGMPDETVTRELLESRCVLEQRLGIPVQHFAFPYGRLGDIPDDYARRCRGAGYMSACSTRYGRRNIKGDLFALKRVGIEPADDFVDFTGKLQHVDVMRGIKRQVKEVLYRVGVGYG